jgi:cytochrome c oxidase subunit 3
MSSNQAGYTTYQGHTVRDGSLWGNPAPLVYSMSRFGMWLFLATEILLFAILFTAYSIAYYRDAAAFHASAKELSVAFGTANTVILLFSSFTVAWSIEAVKRGNNRLMLVLLGITIACGLAFLVNKKFEYGHKVHEVELAKEAIAPELYQSLKAENKCEETFDKHHGEDIMVEKCKVVPFNLNNITYGDLAKRDPSKPAFASMFFFLYFIMTGIHGLHIIIGLGLLIWVMKKGLKNEFHPGWYTPVEVAGLYWHLVDLIWIYLFPLLYLVA